MRALPTPSRSAQVKSGQTILLTLAAVVGLVVLLLFAGYVWPTTWQYPQGQAVMGDKIYPLAVRVNRFSGKAEALTINGWQAPTPAPAQPAAAAPIVKTAPATK